MDFVCRVQTAKFNDQSNLMEFLEENVRYSDGLVYGPT